MPRVRLFAPNSWFMIRWRHLPRVWFARLWNINEAHTVKPDSILRSTCASYAFENIFKLHIQNILPFAFAHIFASHSVCFTSPSQELLGVSAGDLRLVLDVFGISAKAESLLGWCQTLTEFQSAQHQFYKCRLISPMCAELCLRSI